MNTVSGKVKLLTTILAGAILSSCGGSGNGGSSGGGVSPSPSSNGQVTIDAMTSVPVINGSATQGTLYLHNYGNTAADKFRFSLNEETTMSKLRSLLSAMGLKLNRAIINDEGFTLINPELCQSIPAGGYCAINFTTPSLTVGNRGNSLVKLEYHMNGNNETTTQVVNYEYTSLEALPGVNFTGSLTVSGEQNETRHIVGYLYAGGDSGSVYDNVRLHSSSATTLISNGFIDGQQVASGQVIAVEFATTFQSNRELGVNVIPYWGDKAITSKALKSSGNGGSGVALNLTLTPQQNTVNFLFGVASIMSAPSVSPSIINVTNNGNAASVQGLTTSKEGASASDLNITTNCNGSLLANAGNACQFSFSTSSYTPGSAVVIFKYLGVEVGRETVIWTNDTPYPAIYIQPQPSTASVGKNELMPESYLAFNVVNVGKAPLNGVTYPVTNSGAGAWIQDGNNCPGSLSPGASCSITGHLAGSNDGTGVVYATAVGNYNSTSYNFNSLPLRYLVTASPIVVFTPNPVSMTLMANGSQVVSQTIKLLNQGNDPALFTAINFDTVGATVVPQWNSGGSSCTPTTTLTEGESCNLVVSYGPAPTNLTANESGLASFVVSYHGGTPDEYKSVQPAFNYNLVGNDSVVVVTPPSAPGLPGGGTESDPFKGNAGLNPMQITTTYDNSSVNYPMTNFNLDITKLPFGLVVDPSSSCATGSNTMTLQMNESCTLVLNVDRSLLTKSPSGGSPILNYSQPKASWTTPMGFYSQSGGLVYLNYLQPTISFVLSNNNAKFESTELTMTAANESVVTTLSGNVWAVSAWLQTMPTTSSTNCLVNPDYSVNCDLIRNKNGKIIYYMPNYLESMTKVSIPLQFSTNADEYAFLNPMYTFIYYNYSAPKPPERYIYIVNNSNNIVSKCIVADDGGLSNCTNSGGNGFSKPMAIILNSAGSLAYVTNFDTSTISKCNVNNQGDLSGCVIAITGLNNPNALVWNNSRNLLYVVNYGNSTISKCSVTVEGNISSCVNSGGSGFNKPGYMALNNSNTLAYIPNIATNTVSRCNINENGNLSGCVATASGFNQPYGMTLNPAGNIAYVANYNNSTVSKCTVNVDGGLSACVNSGGTNFSGSWNIITNNTGTIAYVANFTNSTVSKCSITANNDLADCTNSGGTGFSTPYGMTFKY